MSRSGRRAGATVGVTVALLGAVLGGASTVPSASAAFDAKPVSSGNALTAATLAAPTGAGCTWTGTNSLQLTWTNTNGSTASGHRQERSNSSGSGFTTLGTTSPAGTVTATDTNPAPPTLRYYRVRATAATTWVSPPSSEVVSNTCIGTVVAFAGGGATNACSYSGSASGLALDFAGLGVASLTIDPATGDLLVFDSSCIRRITQAGVVSPIAGGGATTSCGTTTATALALGGPGGLVADGAGNLYVADRGNNCVRRIDSGGTVTAVAGGGATTTCGTTTATNVSLSQPLGIGLVGGVLYVADAGRSCIRRINGATVTAAGGTGAASSSCAATGATATAVPITSSAMMVDGSGQLVVNEINADCVLRIDPGTGLVTRLAGGGSTQSSCSYAGAATSASYSAALVSGIAVDSSGTVFFGVTADSDPMNRVCVVGISGSSAVQTAGRNGSGNSGDNGPAIGASFTNIRGLTVSSTGDLFVVDAAQNLIRKVLRS